MRNSKKSVKQENLFVRAAESIFISDKAGGEVSMERRIKYFSNDLIDKTVLENNCPTNSLSIKIPFSYAANLVNLNWNDILYAMENEYFDKASAVEYAVLLLVNGSSDESIIDLAGLNVHEITKEEILQKFVVKFARRESSENKKEAKEKIMYILLNLLYENRDIFEDPLKAVEIVYDDFGFPKIIEGFVRYMPTEKNESGSETQMYERWKDYLNNQKNRFAMS